MQSTADRFLELVGNRDRHRQTFLPVLLYRGSEEPPVTDLAPAQDWCFDSNQTWNSCYTVRYRYRYDDQKAPMLATLIRRLVRDITAKSEYEKRPPDETDGVIRKASHHEWTYLEAALADLDSYENQPDLELIHNFGVILQRLLSVGDRLLMFCEVEGEPPIDRLGLDDASMTELVSILPERFVLVLAGVGQRASDYVPREIVRLAVGPDYPASRQPVYPSPPLHQSPELPVALQNALHARVFADAEAEVALPSAYNFAVRKDSTPADVDAAETRVTEKQGSVWGEQRQDENRADLLPEMEKIRRELSEIKALERSHEMELKNLISRRSRGDASKLKQLIPYAMLAGGIVLGAWLGPKVLPLFFGAISPRNSGDEESIPPAATPVECSVFAPPRVRCGTSILVQIFAHPPGGTDQARIGAQQFDSDAQLRGFTSLRMELSSGSRIGVQLDAGDLLIDDHEPQEILWRDDVVGVSFLVSAPKDTQIAKRHATARFLVDGVPAGRINFVIEVIGGLETESAAAPLGDSAVRYRRAFISYASEDRDEVLKRVQTLKALDIDFFQDILDLAPGDRWKQKLYAEIDQCDLFLLFWSSASKASKWVRKEGRHALGCQTRNPNGAPEVIPMIIEGPPPPKPWPEFAHLHFNDELIYLMRHLQDSR